ncbi:hypothetical protein [Streptomyces sp. NPDC058867]|uniref:hypothetical protein n=1 Tax=unclassified Streptomyces TaxID=2593676 RepID=UPI00368047A9
MPDENTNGRTTGTDKPVGDGRTPTAPTPPTTPDYGRTADADRGDRADKGVQGDKKAGGGRAADHGPVVDGGRSTGLGATTGTTGTAKGADPAAPPPPPPAAPAPVPLPDSPQGRTERPAPVGRSADESRPPASKPHESKPHDSEPHAGDAHRKSPDKAHDAGTKPLLSREESDKLDLRLQGALSGFIDAPRAAVEEADQLLEELAGRVTEALHQRRDTLRGSWHDQTASDTERLRLALRDYRELADRLLHV